MGCSSSLPDRNSGRLSGLNSENSGATDAKNLRVKVTIGASFLSQTIALQDSTTVKFEIWDTAGQERYAALAPLYYRGASVAVVVYDITSPESFQKAQYWVKELQKHGSPDMVMALVGNKADLLENREVSDQDGMEYAEKNRMFFIETSAKTADNINQLFEASRPRQGGLAYLGQGGLGLPRLSLGTMRSTLKGASVQRDGMRGPVMRLVDGIDLSPAAANTVDIAEDRNWPFRYRSGVTIGTFQRGPTGLIACVCTDHGLGKYSVTIT
ncbi:hypothetical protein CDL15_Pgr026068 [Punica granatum]|uniref:Ras-related protein RABF1 n=1 Tax=Punica granatum TaxID=22663 RepID=A0A218WCM9_PUNGR|nr:hypothetical protein CDL15_Pgr026068 [Punica granatum]